MSERTTEWADGGNDGTRGVAPHFDEVIHAPIRLRICGLLSASDSVRFDVLRDTLGISDATCSKHLKTLADAGYVAIEKKPGLTRRYPITWVSLTGQGLAAFNAHVEALRQIVAGVMPDPAEPRYDKAR